MIEQCSEHFLRIHLYAGSFTHGQETSILNTNLRCFYLKVTCLVKPTKDTRTDVKVACKTCRTKRKEKVFEQLIRYGAIFIHSIYLNHRFLSNIISNKAHI